MVFNFFKQKLQFLSAAACVGGFTQYSQFCYAYIDKLENWVDAASHCRSLGGFLAEPRTEQQNIYIRQLVAHHSAGADSATVWIGGEDHVTEGHWYWAQSGAAVAGFTDWRQGEPSNSPPGGEDCMEYRIPFLHWNDRNCSVLQTFVCQRPLSDDVVG